MKNIKFLLYTAAVLFIVSMFSVPVYGIEVSPGGPYYVNDTLSFRPTNSSFGNVYRAVWTFGDGSTYTSTYGMDTVTHSYKTAGRYTVRVVGDYGSGQLTETVTVNIQNTAQKRVEVDPAQPIAGQAATFRAYNFSTPDSLVWDMGDGTILNSRSRRGRFSRTPRGANGQLNRFNRSNRSRSLQNRFQSRIPGPRGSLNAGSTVTHTYQVPGTYTVRVRDFSGDDGSPYTMTVTVRLPDRGITYTPSAPLAGVPVQFNAVNFLSGQIDWNFGDGNSVNGGNATTTHVYMTQGTYTVTAKETGTNYTPVTVIVNVTEPNRLIGVSPRSPLVDMDVMFQAQNFITQSIDWNFGDGTIVTGGSTLVTHRYQNPGTYTISAKDSTINHTPVTFTLSVGPENRYIAASPPEVLTNDDVTVTAYNFRGDFVLWNFGDGTQRSGARTETHQYTRAGTYTITAYDENGESRVPFTAQVTVRGIQDDVNLEIAQLSFENGKYYKVVPKNSKNIRAVLKMKMKGTGVVSGHFIVDGRPFEFFNEVASQGEIKEISTKNIPGLPVLSSGIHTVTVRLTKPSGVPLNFPVLKYYVLPYQLSVKTTAPSDGFIAKENEIPEFAWEETKGATNYQVAFSNNLYPMLNNSKYLRWADTGAKLKYTPGPYTWKQIKRNRWTYWRVRALNGAGTVIAESDIHDMKVVIATAKVTVDKVTKLNGDPIPVTGTGTVQTGEDDLLVHGSIQYMGKSKFIVLRVYVDNQLTDQLLFRDFKKKEIRYFETSIPNKNSKSRVQFKVLKTSSPAVIVGIKTLTLKK